MRSRAADAGFGVRDVSLRYGRRPALDGVTLRVARGAVAGVVGGDGAGKTSLLRVLAGTASPSSGSVERPPRGRIGYVSAGPGLYRDLSVTENLSFVATAFGLDRSTFVQRAEPLLARTGLAEARDRPAGLLSGGMRQKLALAMAVLSEPELLVLDEVTTGVDPVSRLELWRLIAGIAAGGSAVVFATTYIDEADRADQVLVLDQGRSLWWGAPEDLVARTPGIVVSAATQPVGLDVWRRGAGWRAWSPGATVPAAATAVVPDLKDAVIVASFAAAAKAAAPGGSSAAAARPAPEAPPVTPFAARSVTAGHAHAEVIGVDRRFGDVVVVDDVDLRVEAGEVVGLLGANGAGKTTLIRLLLGLLAPSSGVVRLFGDSPSMATRRRIGYVPQGLGLYEDLSVRQNIAFVEGAFGVRRPTSLPADLEPIADGAVRDLPLGTRRRAAFAAALVHEPELLVLDEPTSGVDPLGSAWLWDTIRSAAEHGAGVLVTTHSMEESDQCDRLVVMAEGRVVAAGTVERIVGGATAVEVTSERWSDAFSALDAAGIQALIKGRRLRAIGVSQDAVEGVLGRDGIRATVQTVPATFEEAFVSLTLAAREARAAQGTERR